MNSDFAPADELDAGHCAGAYFVRLDFLPVFFTFRRCKFSTE